MLEDNTNFQNDNEFIIINTDPNFKNDSSVNNENTETNNTTVEKNIPNHSVVDNKPQELIPKIRDNMVSKATDFLIATPVQNTMMERKINFLRQKGLTDQEIQLSLQKALLYSNKNAQNSSSSTQLYYNFPNTPGAVQSSYKLQNWFRLFFGPIVIAATIIYFGNHLYKKYIAKWLFGAYKSPVEERLVAVELSLKQCVALLEKNNSMFDSSNTTYIDRQKELDQLRAELKSIKSLLLNRFQFPPAPVSSSIPQWQLAKNVKPQGEQQNKVNGTDTLNPPQNNMIKNLVYGPHVSSIVDVDNDTNSSVHNGTSSSLSSIQNTIVSSDVIAQTNGDKHD